MVSKTFGFFSTSYCLVLTKLKSVTTKPLFLRIYIFVFLSTSFIKNNNKSNISWWNEVIIEFVYFIFVSNKSLPTFQLRLPNEKQLVQTISISRQNGKTVFVSLNEFTYLKVWLFLMRQAENRSCYQNFLFLSNFCLKIFRSQFLTA